jgi:predicted glycosyl hydrolase (DUF1957 family)
MIYTDTTVDYATERTESHLSNFDELRTMIEAGGGVGSLDPICISRLEAKNNLFAAMDYRVYGE